MRRSGHPSRPRAITCCFFASLKTLLISTKATCLTPKSTSRAAFSLAGFQVTLIGRFWVTPGVGTDRLWTALPETGAWIGLGHYTPSDPTFRQKLAFWRQGYDPHAEPRPIWIKKGRRMD